MWNAVESFVEAGAIRALHQRVVDDRNLRSRAADFACLLSTGNGAKDDIIIIIIITVIITIAKGYCDSKNTILYLNRKRVGGVCRRGTNTTLLLGFWLALYTCGIDTPTAVAEDSIAWADLMQIDAPKFARMDVRPTRTLMRWENSLFDGGIVTPVVDILQAPMYECVQL